MENNENVAMKSVFFQRVIAYGLDIILSLLLAMVLLSLWVLPRYHGEALGLVRQLAENGLHLTTEFVSNLPDMQQVALMQFMKAIHCVTLSVIFLYFFLCEFFSGGSSIGKGVFHLRVASVTTQKPLNVTPLLWRTTFTTLGLLLFVPFLIVNTLLGTLRKDRRFAQDLVSKSLIVRC